MKICWENNTLIKGVSGIMRVKNDAEFIEECIDSCIDALDELIIVHNGCTDNSPLLIEKKRRQYSDKIRVFEYPYLVYGVGLSLDDYKKVVDLPEDSPHLLCNYYNFALSKVKYQYALKIDADQIYFKERLKEVCDICRSCEDICKNKKYFIGYCFNLYFRIYRYLCTRLKREIPVLFPQCVVRFFGSSYKAFSIYQFKKGRVCLSLSGVNVFYDKAWYVPLGGLGKTINILPPFNGENDHILFRVIPELYYRKFDTCYYNILRSTNYSIIEEFVHPYSYQYYGFCWYHLNAMRNSCRALVKEEKHKQPSRFVSLKAFCQTEHSAIKDASDKRLYSLHQRIIFSLLYPVDYNNIIKYSHLLDLIF